MKRLLLYSLFVVLFSGSTLTAQTPGIVSSLREHVTLLASDSLSGRAFGFPEKAMAIEYITEQFKLAGIVPFNENYINAFQQFAGLSLIEGKNIIGIIEGSDPVLKNEFIVIGAHYDHMGWKREGGKKIVFNGADDNASGVASIIETGRILAANKKDLKRSIIIAAFDGEEAGLVGSSIFFSHKGIDSSKIKSMFSLDMVGMFSKNKGVDLNGFNSLKNGEKFALEIAAREMIPVGKSSNSIESRTDTWSFGKRNIPAFYISTGLISPYHKPEDDSNLLDYEGMSKIVSLISSITSELANMETIEPNKRFIARSVNPKFMTGLTFEAGNNTQFYKSMFYDAKPALSVAAGISSKLKISRMLSFQPSLVYEMTGGNTETGYLQMHSVSPQADILITTPQNDYSRPIAFIIAGGYYRHNFNATGKGSPADFSSTYVTNEKGLRVGFGFQYLKLQMGYLYKFGLDKINRDETNGKIYNRGSYVSITRFF